jgi:hypothetical protein
MGERSMARRYEMLGIVPAAVVALIAGLLPASPRAGGADDSAPRSSLAYKGHENDADSDHLVEVFPAVIGTRLDDCQTCHTAGVVERVANGRDAAGGTKTVEFNPCSYCHLIPFPDERVRSGAPADYGETLNPFGRAYRDGGRDAAALRAIAAEDSDADGHGNAAELAALRYPGDAASHPGQPTVPVRVLGRADLAALPQHDQLMLMNSHRQHFDTYALYAGVKVVDILEAVGADLANASNVTFLAPDGFAVDFDLRNVQEPFPAGLFFDDLDPDGFADPAQGFVHYPSVKWRPEGLVDGEPIPGESWLMIGSHRDGQPLRPLVLDPATGRLTSGEGPFRLLAPQGLLGGPGPPDRGAKVSPSGFDDGHDFDPALDHNAGLCVRGIVAIRVNPLPAGHEEFDWKNGGFSLLEKGQVIVYGAGIGE